MIRSLTLAGLLAGLVGLSVPALAAPTGGTQSAGTVTVFLRPPDEAALGRLARLPMGHTGTRQARIAAVRALVPDASPHERAAAALGRHGFTVVGETSWSVTATAPAGTVAATFGTRPTLGADPSPARRRAATGALPDLPDDLGALAIAAFPTATGPATFHRQSRTLVGTDLRNAYTSSARTAAGKAPYDGSGTRLTVATLQLDGWNSADLAAYADGHGLPYDSTTLTQIPVNQPSVPTTWTDNNDIEVDLDQQAILSTDPHARQRVYFAPNTAAGFADGFAQVLDDVLANSSSYHGGDTAIAALSVSWGACEQSTGSSEIVNTLEPIMKSLVAAGVTIFATTGDTGAYDCMDRQGNPLNEHAVDYPGSSPEVVAVGGTSLDSTNFAANDGTNWSETAWSCGGFTDCADNGGSGGGASTIFTEPGYQSATLSASLNARDARLVPDIAANADPASGFTITTSDATYGPTVTLGGTSLAAPVAAALFVTMLSANEMTHGIGDIHTALYQAASEPGTLRDVTSGANGSAGTDLAAVGYDTVTGLGAPLWPALAPTLLRGLTPPTTPSAKPTARATLALLHPHAASTWRSVKATWAGSHADAAKVTVTRVGGSTVVSRARTSTSGTATFTGTPGATYRLVVRQVGAGGSTTATTTIAMPVDDSAFGLHGWSRHRSSAAIAGSYVTSAKRAGTAGARVAGRRYALVVRVGPTLGRLAVLVNGHRVRTIDLHASRSGFRTVPVWGGAAAALASRVITLKPAGREQVGLDALYAYR